MKELGFYFDFSSPFAYLGATQVEAVAAKHGARVDYRPFLLGALFKQIGTPGVPLFTLPEAKRRHVAEDIARFADSYGVPFRFPSRFPMNTVKPLRMVLALPEERRAPFIQAVFRAYWADDRDLQDDATLLELTAALEEEGVALVEAARGQAMRDALRAATDEALARGVCGAPCFLVGDLLFWGQDRLIFAEKALGGWRPRGE